MLSVASLNLFPKVVFLGFGYIKLHMFLLCHSLLKHDYLHARLNSLSGKESNFYTLSYLSPYQCFPGGLNIVVSERILQFFDCGGWCGDASAGRTDEEVDYQVF